MSRQAQHRQTGTVVCESAGWLLFVLTFESCVPFVWLLLSVAACISKFTTVDEVVDEIYAEVKNVEPMVAGKDRLPSTAFFLLYKLFELRLTKRQMHGQEPDSASEATAKAT